MLPIEAYHILFSWLGIRGELKISVKLEFFGELTSGVDLTNNVIFFSCMWKWERGFSTVALQPTNFDWSAAKTVYPYLKLKDIQGFVEELIVDDDPEYNWKDTFRTSRSSNEARQYLLYKLSGYGSVQVLLYL